MRLNNNSGLLCKCKWIKRTKSYTDDLYYSKELKLGASVLRTDPVLQDNRHLLHSYLVQGYMCLIKGQNF